MALFGLFLDNNPLGLSKSWGEFYENIPFNGRGDLVTLIMVSSLLIALKEAGNTQQGSVQYIARFSLYVRGHMKLSHPLSCV
jgi:hypothetical protein